MSSPRATEPNTASDSARFRAASAKIATRLDRASAIRDPIAPEYDPA